MQTPPLTNGVAESASPIKVRFLSIYLWSADFDGAVKEFLYWLEGIGLIISATVLSRVDICVDSDELLFEEADLSKMITRARGK